MPSTNVIRLSERREVEPQLKVMPNHSEQVAEQINDGRPVVEQVLKVYPLDWTHDAPNFTAEELTTDSSASGAIRTKPSLKSVNPDHFPDAD